MEPNLRDLLAEVGLANRSFYRHFSSKDDLLLVMLEDVQRRLTSFVAERMAAQRTAVGQVRAWVLGVLQQAVDEETARLGRPFLVHGPRLQDAYPDVYRVTGAALLDLLEAAIRSGVSSRKLRSRDPRADARAIFHLTLAVMQSHVLDRTVPSEQEQAAVLDFALRAMR
jgi:AcrR family transcriptional regulator